MLAKNKMNEIVSNAINTAICIDDEYKEPYGTCGKDLESPMKLYNSFRKEGECNLDIYTYKGYEDFESAKYFLLGHKDLMILDWELSPNSSIKYLDSLKVLEAAINDNNIRFVAIYTQSPDLENIALTVYSYFINILVGAENDAIYGKLYSKVAEFFSENLFDCDEDDIVDYLDSNLPGFTLNGEHRNELTKKIRKDIGEKIQDKRKEFCSLIIGLIEELEFESLEDLFVWYECYKHNNTIANIKQDIYSVKPINGTSIFINNTAVIIMSKKCSEIDEEKGIEPNRVFEVIQETIAKIPNARSFLFSMRLKEVLSHEMAIIGKGLGGIDEQALMHHTKTYKENNDLDSFLEYITMCMTGQIVDSIKENINIDEIKDLFLEEIPFIATDAQLAALNKFMTFTDKTKLTDYMHHIKTGDIFELQVPLYDKGGKKEFLICITQSCDCLRPDTKIFYNYAFAYGLGVEMKTALKNVEKKCYSFISETIAIEWCDIFFTIHIEKQSCFDINKNIIVFLNNGRNNELKYLGNQKSIYTQRVINNTFNKALRMGVDLPNKAKNINE